MIAGTAAVVADGDENFLPFFPAISHVRILCFGLKMKKGNRNVSWVAASAVLLVLVLVLVLGSSRVAEVVLEIVDGGFFGQRKYWLVLCSLLLPRLLLHVLKMGFGRLDFGFGFGLGIVDIDDDSSVEDPDSDPWSAFPVPAFDREDLFWLMGFFCFCSFLTTFFHFAVVVVVLLLLLCLLLPPL